MTRTSMKYHGMPHCSLQAPPPPINHPPDHTTNPALLTPYYLSTNKPNITNTQKPATTNVSSTECSHTVQALQSQKSHHRGRTRSLVRAVICCGEVWLHPVVCLAERANQNPKLGISCPTAAHNALQCTV